MLSIRIIKLVSGDVENIDSVAIRQSMNIDSFDATICRQNR